MRASGYTRNTLTFFGRASVAWWFVLMTLVLAGACVTTPDDVRQQPPAASIDALHAPWRDTRTALVIDAYEQNDINWSQLANEPRVAGVIHRASTGLTADRAYAARQTAAKRHGYLWGAYHVGTADDAGKQVDLFLQTVGDAHGELLALDLEDVSGGKFMNVAQAQIFLAKVHLKTGRYPLVYASQQTLLAIRRTSNRSDVWAHTRLWYARYTDAITDFPSCDWRGYTLWQFSSEQRPGATRGTAFFPISGTRPDIDVNVYPGTVKELRRAWPFE